MSKQSNQRYRKELEKKQATANNKNNTFSNQKEKYDYGDGDFEAPSNSTNNTSPTN